MGFGVLIIAAVSGGLALPAECELPALREVTALKALAQQEGTLSAGLDSVATWCFESSGEWTGGVGTSKAKGKKSAKTAVANPEAEATGECKKAMSSCEAAKAAVLAKAEVSELANAAQADWARQYRELKYSPKRGGVFTRPSVDATCDARNRAELFNQAKGRMDLGRWYSMVQNEYGDYRAWLQKESLKCRKALLAEKKDPLQSTLSIETATGRPRNAELDAGTAVTSNAAVSSTSAQGNAGSLKGEHAGLDEKPMLDKWKYLAERHGELEKDRDYALGFMASRELRACGCTRVNPAAVVRALEKQEGGAAGLALLNAEDASNTKCAVCLLDAYSAWKPRVARQCALMDELTEFELNKLQQSDDANGLPPRCFEETRRQREEKKKLAAAGAPSAADAGTLQAAFGSAAPVTPLATAMMGSSDGGVRGQPVLGTAPGANATAASASSAAQQLDGGGPFTTVDGYTYYRPHSVGTGTTAAAGANPAPANPPSAGNPTNANVPAGPSRPMTGPGVSSPSSAGDEFVPPSAYAPIPTREDGRVYVRLSMSAACVAEILPGPIQARTGDLLLLPFGAKSLQVKSPCGGLAEIYFGRESKPRVSEVFSRTQPLSFVFQPP